MNGQSAVNVKEEDLTSEAEQILWTMKHLNGKFGIAYLTKLLIGNEQLEFRRDEHAELKTLGVFAGRSFDKIKQSFLYLVELGYIEPANSVCTTFRITEKGQTFLEKPQDVRVPANRLRLQRHEYILRNRLRILRRNIARKKRLPSYRIFSDYTLERIIRIKPASLKQLREIPGLSIMSAEEYGHGILTQVKDIMDLKQEDLKRKMQQRTGTPTYQQTKELFEAGKSMEEIARIKGVKPKTVQNYLEELHRCGEVDLLPWIEENIRTEDLSKGVEYFKETGGTGLRAAYEALGLDYNTLRFCRLYLDSQQTQYTAITVVP